MSELRTDATSMQLVLEGHTLALTCPGIRISGVQPGAVILRGAPEEKYALRLAPAPGGRAWTATTPLGPAQCRSAEFRDPAGFDLTWTVGELPRAAGVLVTATFRNRTKAAVRLREIVLLRTDGTGVEVEGAPADWMLMSGRGYDAAPLSKVFWIKEQGKRPTIAPEKANDDHWRPLRDFMTLYSDKGRRGLAAAAVSTEAFVDFDWFVNGARNGLEVFSLMSDVVVAPGESRAAETVAFLCGPYDDAVPALLRWIAATHGARTHRGARVGWCSWYQKGSGITAAECREVARVIGRLRERLPHQVIQIDDGFQRQAGDWDCNDTFLEGMEPLIAEFQAAGAEAGIWLAPQAVHESVGGPNYTSRDGRLLDVHPDWFQRDAAGQLVGECGAWTGKAYYLDPTHPGARHFLRRIVRRKREEGFTYVKIDYNYVGDDARWHDPKKTALQAYRDMYRMYREELGEATYLLSCSGFTRGTMGFADASRIGTDSFPAWNRPGIMCLLNCIRGVGATAHANGILYANDPDVTYLKPRKEKTVPQWQSWHSFVGLLGGLMLTSEYFQFPEYQSDDILRLYEVMNPPAPDKGRSLHPGADADHCRFGFVAPRPWGTFATVLVYNPGDEAREFVLDVPALEAVGDTFHAWSFWDGQYLGVINNGYTFRLEPAQCRLLRLSECRPDEPVLVGSDLHLGLGSAEVANWVTTATGAILTLTPAGARDGSLFIHSQRPLLLEGADGSASTALTAAGPDLWRLALRGRSRTQNQTYRIAIR